MAKFLNTSATNYHLEERIKNAQERLFWLQLRKSEKFPPIATVALKWHAYHFLEEK